MSLQMQDWRPAFRAMGAIYERPNLPGAPHVDTLKSDTHTDKYFNSDVREPAVLQAICAEWANVIRGRGQVPDIIIGHAPFANIPAFLLAAELGADYAYSKRNPQGRYSTSYFIRPGEKVIAVADDVVTGRSTRETIEDAQLKGAVILPLVPCMANMSNRPTLEVPSFVDDMELVAAATYTPETYRVREGACELCALGSVALKPREDDNWLQLQAWMSDTPPLVS
jgi:hypothetical protein